VTIAAWNYALTCWLCKNRVLILAERDVTPESAPSLIHVKCPKCGAELRLTPELLEPADTG
jgi:hypothetical protein